MGSQGSEVELDRSGGERPGRTGRPVRRGPDRAGGSRSERSRRRVVRRAAHGEVPRGSRNDREPAVGRRRIGSTHDADDRRGPAGRERGRGDRRARQAQDRNPSAADEQLRGPPIARAMDLHDVATDADEPPFMRRAGCDTKIERRHGGSAEAPDRRRPDPGRAVRPADLTGHPDAGAHRWGARAAGQQDLDRSGAVLDDEPPVRRVEQ